jgi:hypothetical protein
MAEDPAEGGTIQLTLAVGTGPERVQAVLHLPVMQQGCPQPSPPCP